MCTDELDFLLREQIAPNMDEDEDINEIYKDKTNYLNTSIKIDYLRGILDQLEGLGANYVSIMYHPDHIEYELDGILVREATQDEIDQEIIDRKEADLRTIKQRLAEMENTAEQFRKQIERLSSES